MECRGRPLCRPLYFMLRLPGNGTQAVPYDKNSRLTSPDVGTIIIGYDNMPKFGKGDMFYEFLFR